MSQKNNFLILILFFLIFLTKISAQSNWQISLTAGTANPDFSLNSPGFQIEGRIFYEISDSFMVFVTSGFNKWDQTLGLHNISFKSIPLLAGIKLTLPSKLFSPYITGEFGVHFINRNFILESYEQSDKFEGLYKLVSSKPASESVVKFAFGIGVGTTISIYKKLGLDLRLNYNSIRYDFVYIFNPSNRVSSGRIDIFGFLAGIYFKL